MADYLDDNQTEGPEGYFVHSATRPPDAGREQRMRRDGRRRADADVRQSRHRLMWAAAAAGTTALVAVLALITASPEWRSDSKK